MRRTRKPHRPALRGLFTRFVALVLGAAIGVAPIVAMQLPLMHHQSTATFTLAPIRARPGTVTPLAWPSVGSAALFIPSQGVAQGYHDQVVPIASLTKMMTAYVVLKKLPLAIGQTGPCVTVSDSDVATYEALSALDESSVYVVAGESLCEIDLLNGLLVHSASNYAVMLADLVAGGTEAFVGLMNQDAQQLGLDNTHYADVSGFDPDSVSTALDQAQLAYQLMKSPLVRSIVDQTSVTLPVAGTVDSFTPYVGQDNVIGVKSGRTSQAGGCDVMAVTFQLGTKTEVLYAVVLGQEGGDLLGPAGTAALALADSAVQSQLPHSYRFLASKSLGTIGWGARRVTFGVRRSTTVLWPSVQHVLVVQVHLDRTTTTIRRGQRVGWIVVHGLKDRRLELVARASVSPLTLWQRIR